MSFWYPNLSEEQVATSVRENRLAIPPNWSTKVFAALLFLVYWGLCGYFVGNGPTAFYRTIALLLFPFLGWLFFYAVYCQLRENRLTTLETGLSAEANWQLIQTVFGELNWNIQQNTPQVVRAFTDGYISQVGIALIQPNRLLLNVLHIGHRRGRLPFSFGQNEKMMRLLVSRLNQHLAAA
ncbi:hypothetical protein [Hymenobacter latericus]|uniref:hypothetical protein n=1 Tax=Hymenobacter sp. YIM 151858-1 TaxID=2987688 RepID=UPI0022270A0E|nr:hypothetical protein [Hymenobacter sp. YIM 151858-1]UYZ59647.1 hypothetical protein OIS50_02340 [Hymenobacter sp. YIM 151858-1]